MRASGSVGSDALAAEFASSRTPTAIYCSSGVEQERRSQWPVRLDHCFRTAHHSLFICQIGSERGEFRESSSLSSENTNGNRRVFPLASSHPARITRSPACAVTGGTRGEPPTESHTRHAAITVKMTFVYRSTAIWPPTQAHQTRRSESLTGLAGPVAPGAERKSALVPERVWTTE